MPNNTKHSPSCRRVFSRYDLTCPRCIELSTGSAPRQGWNSPRKAADLALSQAIANHDCKKSGCLPICTAFDW